MNQLATRDKTANKILTSVRDGYLSRALFAGLLIPFGFAPFHLPGFTILGLALLFAQLNQAIRYSAFFLGFVFGIGFFGLGVSWVYVSIHDFGHLNSLLAALITLGFILYLSIFPGLMSLLYTKIAMQQQVFFSCVLFSALWCLSEYCRATFMTGFPWLLIGFGQIDTPLKQALPFIGVYGVSFLTCLSATFLAISIQQKKRFPWLIGFLGLLLLPSLLHYATFVTPQKKSLSVGIIQANLSMKEKWDETLFWSLMEHYESALKKMIPHTQVVVMPESAIPLPAIYVSERLEQIHQFALEKGSSVLLGIPKRSNLDDTAYYNSLMSLGHSIGSYHKQHLVPFGEIIPPIFQNIMTSLSLPMNSMQAGSLKQPLIKVHHHPIATLICYEVAYPMLLRAQLPLAEWIVSVSDIGWFGHSFAMYQQLQMAQTLSILTGRFQIVANNDGLSSIINPQGDLVTSLPAFQADTLSATIYPCQGTTPWVRMGDIPILCFFWFIVILALAAKHKRRYPNRPI